MNPKRQPHPQVSPFLPPPQLRQRSHSRQRVTAVDFGRLCNRAKYVQNRMICM
jgi:hypothetical protein